MRLAIFIVIFALSDCYAQCDECKQILPAIFNTYRANNSRISVTDFKNSFCSEDYKKYMEAQGGGGKITIPIKGIPIGFGGDFDEQSFQELKNAICNSGSSYINEKFANDFMNKIANPMAIKAWERCIERCNDAKPGLKAKLVGEDDNNSFTLKLSYIPFGTTYECKLSNITFEGATYDSKILYEGLVIGIGEKLIPIKRKCNEKIILTINVENNVNGVVLRKAKRTTVEKSLVIGKASFTGETIDDVPNGQGTYIQEDGTTYIGCLLDGRYNGHGAIQYYENGKPTGGKYEGEWVNDEYDGRGKETWPNGDLDEGYFENGYLVKGTRKYADGGMYEGEFSNYQPNGKGRLKNDVIQYEGMFKDGDFHGRGTIIYYENGKPTGGKYEGEWVNDEYDGEGVETFDDGEYDKGTYKAGKLIGVGKRVFPSGSYYVGTFHRIDSDSVNEPHGQGILYAKDGTILKKGTWENGKLVEK